MSNKKFLKYLFLNIIHDLKIALSYGLYSSTSTNKINRNATIFLFFSVTLILIFKSSNQQDLIINLFSIIVFGLISLFIFWLSLSFWFIYVKTDTYKMALNSKEVIKSIKEKVYDELEFGFIEDYKDAIRQVTYAVSEGYKVDMYRYGLEIFALLAFLFLYNTYYFISDLIIVGGTFIYSIKFEKEGHLQVFKQISLLMYCLKKLIDIDPGKTKNFIQKSKKIEIRNLTELYYFVKEDF